MAGSSVGKTKAVMAKAARSQSASDRLFEEGTILIEEGIIVLEAYVDLHQDRSPLGAALRLLKMADAAFMASCDHKEAANG